MSATTAATAALVLAACAQVLLTVGVGLRLITMRVRAMKAERVHPQSVATARQMAEGLQDRLAVQASDNFRNLFEVPVLFYAAVAVALGAGLAGPVLATLAWAFVALRVAHSIIQCGGNRVMRRFQVFVAGFAMVLAMWLTLGAQAAMVMLRL